MAETRLLENENVKCGHFFDVVVHDPETVVKTVCFGVLDVGNEGAHIATDAEGAMTEWPAFSLVVAFECEVFGFDFNWV